jgi:hypothetical protein
MLLLIWFTSPVTDDDTFELLQEGNRTATVVMAFYKLPATASPSLAKPLRDDYRKNPC